MNNISAGSGGLNSDGNQGNGTEEGKSNKNEGGNTSEKNKWGGVGIHPDLAKYAINHKEAEKAESVTGRGNSKTEAAINLYTNANNSGLIVIDGTLKWNKNETEVTAETIRRIS